MGSRGFLKRQDFDEDADGNDDEHDNDKDTAPDPHPWDIPENECEGKNIKIRAGEEQIS